MVPSLGDGGMDPLGGWVQNVKTPAPWSASCYSRHALAKTEGWSKFAYKWGGP